MNCNIAIDVSALMNHKKDTVAINPGFENKVALVAGANHGIGEATAKALTKQGGKGFIIFSSFSASS